MPSPSLISTLNNRKRLSRLGRAKKRPSTLSSSPYSPSSALAASPSTLLYLPLYISELDRTRMLNVLLFAHFSAFVCILFLSAFATYQMNGLVNADYSILSEENALDIEIILLASFDAGLVLSHLAALGMTYLLSFNRYRIRFISAGIFEGGQWILALTIFLTLLAALALLLSEDAVTDKYEKLFLEGIKNYKKEGHTVASSKIDSTQIIFRCCGARDYTDWFDADVWAHLLQPGCPTEKEMRETEVSEVRNASTIVPSVYMYHQWPFIPFSCCNDSSTMPCLHFVPYYSKFDEVANLKYNNFRVGCSDGFVLNHLWTVHRHGLGWAVSIGVHLFTSLLMRYFLTSVYFSLLWSRRADSTGLGWLVGPSPRLINLPVLVKGYTKLECRYGAVLEDKDEGHTEDDEDDEDDQWRRKKRRKRDKARRRNKGRRERPFGAINEADLHRARRLKISSSSSTVSSADSQVVLRMTSRRPSKGSPAQRILVTTPPSEKLIRRIKDMLYAQVSK